MEEWSCVLNDKTDTKTVSTLITHILKYLYWKFQANAKWNHISTCNIHQNQHIFNYKFISRLDLMLPMNLIYLFKCKKIQ